MMDYLISLQHKSLRKSFSWSSYVSLLPAATALIGSRVLTYVSYGQIPASLTHTIKASAPIFSVFLSRFYLKHVVHPVVVLSLVPIIVGVTLSSVTDVEFEWWGFVAAMSSTCVGAYALCRQFVRWVHVYVLSCFGAHLHILILSWLRCRKLNEV